ncbi:hypothetical protein ACFLQ2_00080 [archaeon]
MAKTVKRARKTAAKKTKSKAVKKKTVKKKATSRKTVKKKATKRKVVKKKVVKKKAVKKKATKKKVTKKKVIKKKPVKKVTKKKVAKKKVVKKKPAKKAVKKATPRKAAKKKVKRTGPMFDRIVPTRPPEPATGDNPYNIKIVNMVASANFNVELDLFALAREVDTIEYEPEQFPGAILKLSKDGNGVKASLLLFKNGKVICTGARSEDEVEKALLITTEIIADFVS